MANLIRELVNKTIRSLSYSYKKLFYNPNSRQELYKYWKGPDKGNLPEDYLNESENIRSKFLVDIINKYAVFNARILEVGCNAGRNLNFLFKSGYNNIEAIEISEQAIKMFKEMFPEVARKTKIYNMPVEEAITEIKDLNYDIVFTMAVLEHIHKDSYWIFPEIVRITKDILITIEDEHEVSNRHFPRNYQKVFEPLGIKQIDKINCGSVQGLGHGFVARVFRRQY